MEEGEVLEALLQRAKDMGISVYELARRSKIPYSTLNNKKKRESKLSIEQYAKLCEGLKLSPAEFFLTDGATVLSPEERELIDCYRRTADPGVRKTIIETVKIVADLNRQE